MYKQTIHSILIKTVYIQRFCTKPQINTKIILLHKQTVYDLVRFISTHLVQEVLAIYLMDGFECNASERL